MIIFPAIDIKDGKVVRLRQGEFDKVTVYADDPLKTARQWVEKGARWLHIVDLDGAQSGGLKNFSIICRIAQAVPVPVQVGGGIRSLNDIRLLLGNKIQRVIVSTKAIEDGHFLVNILARWPQQIAVSLDCRDGFIAQQGWTKTSEVKAVDFAQDLIKLGLTCLIYTDIQRDGMLSGPNVEGLTELLNAVKIPVIASGGISGLPDIEKLIPLKSLGLSGIIVGRALYEGKLLLEDALQLC